MSFAIHRKPVYRIYIEEGSGGAMAHVAELPGCFATASDASKAVASTPKAIIAFLAWLKSHREPLVPEAHVSRPTVADLYIAEVQSEGVPTQAGSTVALFEFDQEPWSDEKLERTLRWLSYSRADLLSKIEGMSEAELMSTHIEADRTLWDTLWHIANAEYGYINRIAGPLEGIEPITGELPSDVRDRLAAIREMLQKRVRAILPENRTHIIYPTWANRPNEPWTLPKALRRAIEHEKEHLTELSS